MTIPLDKAIETHRDARRHRDAFQEAISESHELGIKRGADWQLEQVVVWLRDNLDDRHVWADVLSPSPLPYVDVDVESIIIDLMEAMRPQEKN